MQRERNAGLLFLYGTQLASPVRLRGKACSYWSLTFVLFIFGNNWNFLHHIWWNWTTVRDLRLKTSDDRCWLYPPLYTFIIIFCIQVCNGTTSYGHINKAIQMQAYTWWWLANLQGRGPNISARKQISPGLGKFDHFALAAGRCS